MTQKTKQATRARAANVRRPLWWLVGVILLAIAVMASHGIWDKSATAAKTDPAKLVGRWMRTDGGYVLQLSNPIFDGRLTATYFNPRSINVARSEWKFQDGHLIVFVELRDEGYPGSTYTLVYQPGTDRLVGIYFQAALRQQFDVVFERKK
jgi:hypothetical protein